MFFRPSGSIGYLQVSGNAQTRTIYSSNDACCSNLIWASRSVIAFDDDYRVKTVDLATGRVMRIADFSNFTISKDGRWVAGWADSGGHSPETIAVVSIIGGGCRLVPQPASADDTQPRFSADGTRLTFRRVRFRGDHLFNGRGHLVSIGLSALRRPPAGHRC